MDIKHQLIHLISCFEKSPIKEKDQCIFEFNIFDFVNFTIASNF
jgi:hypothetical protein